jgi:hypothetical protein
MPEEQQQRMSEVIAGIVSALFALVSVLDEKGLVPFEDYRAKLHEYSDEMPEEDADSGTGFVFERLIDLLNVAVAQRRQ